MDNEEILGKMHRLHLLLADELKRICEKYEIHYFMIAGTLLGAVRHKGFIPWDDDMDFGMFREDYEKFLEIVEPELDKNRFYILTDRKEKKYPYNFAKLCLTGTRVFEEFSAEANNVQGIYIDIFPFDAVSDKSFQANMQYKAFWLFRNLLWVKCGYGGNKRKKQFSFKLAKMISMLVSIEFLKGMKQKVITKYSEQQTAKVVTGDGTYGLKKETLPRKWLQDIASYKFENRIYPGIREHHSYLSYFYGDYMALPPKSKQNHHSRLAVDFGRYE